MFGQSAEKIRTRMNSVEADAARVAAQLPSLALDEPEAYRHAAGELEDLNRERDRLSAALDEIANRDAKAARERAEKERRAKLRAARNAADAYVATAAEVDAALKTLERAATAHETAAGDLSRALAAAGCSDAPHRLRNRFGPNMRWAGWHAAPQFFRMLEAHFVSTAKRCSLEKLAAGLVPTLDDPEQKESADGDAR